MKQKYPISKREAETRFMLAVLQNIIADLKATIREESQIRHRRFIHSPQS